MTWSAMDELRYKSFEASTHHPKRTLPADKQPIWIVYNHPVYKHLRPIETPRTCHYPACSTISLTAFPFLT